MKNVQVNTSIGTFTLELYWKHAPNTCQHIVNLCERAFYDDSPIHRVVAGVMIMMGDPTGTGRGSHQNNVPDEIHPALKHTGAGVVSMANVEGVKDSNGSQFLITLAPSPWLDGKHTIIGRVSSGMKVVQRIGLVSTGTDDRPTEDIRIVSARTIPIEE